MSTSWSCRPATIRVGAARNPRAESVIDVDDPAGESLELEQPPVPDDGQQDLVAVDSQVVDPGLGDLRGLDRWSLTAGIVAICQHDHYSFFGMAVTKYIDGQPERITYTCLRSGHLDLRFVEQLTTYF